MNTEHNDRKILRVKVSPVYDNEVLADLDHPMWKEITNELRQQFAGLLNTHAENISVELTLSDQAGE